MKQVKSNSKILLFLLFFLCCLTGCKTSRKAETSKLPESARYLSSKVRLTIPSKDAVFTVNGTMKLISGERMQLSFLMPIIRTEVARMEVTPEEILLVDRMGKRYVRATRKELKDVLPKKGGFCPFGEDPVRCFQAQRKEGADRGRSWVFLLWRKAGWSCPAFPTVRFP